MKDLVQIGKFGKPHGLQGELKAVIEESYEDVIFEVDALFVGIANQRLPYFIENVRGGGTLIIKLEEVDDKDLASTLQNAPLFLPAAVLPAPAATDSPASFQQWVGWTITDEKAGTIGTITEIVEMPQHTLVEVDRQGSPVMIPLHADLIIEVKATEKLIHMQLPEGLLDL